MKRLLLLTSVSLFFVFNRLCAQLDQTGRLFLPFLQKESQSNIIVTISDLFAGESCPFEYTNALSNTNLFMPQEQQLIKEIFVKYKNVTTNIGPPGTVLTNLYKTDHIIEAMNRRFTNETWVADFKYTNFEAREEIRFGAGFLADFRNEFNDGYRASFTRTGGGTLLNCWEIKHGSPNGLLVRFDDQRPQGTNWNFKSAIFTTNSRLIEYRQYTNGMVFGKFLMWNPVNGNLMVEADFKEPYDFEKHRTDLQIPQ